MRKKLVLLCLAVLTAGCATVTTGRTQKVAVDSNPQGAKVTTNTGYKGETPCCFDLERWKKHVIKISKPGFKTSEMTLKRAMCGSTLGNVLCPGVLFISVDAVSGAMYKLVPENVNAELVPGDEKEIVDITPLPKKTTKKVR
jgi:hypothetical protein